MDNIAMQETNKKINPETIKEFRDLGLLNETALRNFNIRQEFEQLKFQGKGSVEAIEVLMDKYNRSWSVINGIVYNK